MSAKGANALTQCVGGSFPYKLFFQVSASGKFEKIEPVREHRQCLLFLYRLYLATLINTGLFQKKVGITFTVFVKIINFYEERTHRGDITFSIIATGNETAEGGET